ncbi:MAG TPA: MBL fold metallo-hydrolase [Steroidobacteraceae bacterium]|nr:MBL fold metallo-hydrolase [Steroidobacteraceae bacterium]
MELSFHGADRDVTGSCHLLECAGRRLLVDCGMFQGGRELDEENSAPLGFDAAAVDVLLLTHAHLDHCGRLPLLVQRGFRGEVIATAATRELARIVMMDAAHMAEDDAAWRGRHPHAGRNGRGGQGATPLYTQSDVEAAMARFGRVAEYRAEIELAPGLRVSFHDAGHILGSAHVLVQVREGGRMRRVLFSGDIGGAGRPIIRDADPPPADIVLMETTYGDRNHRSPAESVAELVGVIAATIARGGNVVIPSFALERSQEILYSLRAAIAAGQLPAQLPVFLDSPMAVSATEVYRAHPECYDAEAAALIAGGTDLFGFPGLRLVRATSESIGINRIGGGAVIMAGSGMCTGGRVRHHLVQNLPRGNASIVFVGFAARGTPARRIIDGARSIMLFGEEVPVRAQVHTINGFSAHADQGELLRWHARVGGAERTVLVHGEPAAMNAFAALLPGVPVSMPGPGDRLTL